MFSTVLNYVLGQVLHPTRNILLWVLLAAGVALAGFSLWQQHNGRTAARLERSAVRAELLDSLQRAGELAHRADRARLDTALTRRQARQAAESTFLRLRDERIEERYHATRVRLPAY